MTFATTPFTVAHVLLSLIGILTGLVVLYGLLRSDRMNGWTQAFLATTVATSLTGFVFAFHGVTPAIVLGVLSLILLGVATAARYAFDFAGPWRWIYAATCVTALYCNVFVLVVQSFLKIPALHALAPKGSEPPFAVAQLLVLLLFVAAGGLSVRRFNPTRV